MVGLAAVVKPTGRESGFALAGVILALTVLSALAFLGAAVARSQLQAATAALDVLHARLAAEGAVESYVGQAVGSAPGTSGTWTEALAAGTVGRLPWSLSSYRIGPEFHLLVGDALIGRTGSRYRVGELVWWLDPAARLAHFGAALEARSASAGLTSVPAVLDPLGARGPHRPCRDDPGLREAFPGALLGTGSLPGEPEWGGQSAYARARLGWYHSEVLLELADERLSDGAVLSGCPTCWAGLVVASGRVTLRGSGAGVLVALEDLNLAPEATWDGVVIVAGDLTLDVGAQLTGLARVGGTATVPDGARLEGAPCAAHAALRAARTLLRPIRVPGPSRLGPIPPVPDWQID